MLQHNRVVRRVWGDGGSCNSVDKSRATNETCQAIKAALYT